MKRKMTFIILSALLSQGAAAYAKQDYQVAVGVGDFSAYKNQLLVLAKDKNTPWTYINKVKEMPSGASNFIPRSTSCNGETCVIGGDYRDAQWVLNPMLLLSTNKGQSWRFVQTISGLPTNLVEPRIYSVSCTESVCAATGSSKNIPLLLVSQNKGQSWAYVNSVLNYKNLFLSSVSCEAERCVAAGSEGFTPMMLMSKDKGLSWELNEDIKNMPSTLMASFNDVACNGSNCVVAGEYGKSDGDGKFPLLVVSNDKGMTWSFVQNITGRSYRGKDFSVDAVNCSNKLCAVLGIYTDNSAAKPFFALSKDQGKSWVTVQKVSGMPAKKLQDVMLRSIHCTESNCLVAGRISSKKGKDAPLIIELDGATFKASVRPIAYLPENFIEGALNTLRCNQSLCSAIGWHDSLPLILESVNGGYSWSFYANTIGQPTDLKDASLMSLG